MKAYRLSIAAVAVLAALAVTTLLAVPDAQAAVTALFHWPTANPVESLQMATALAGLRATHGELTTRIAAKLAELVDGLPEADVRRIEGEHDELVRQAEDVQRQITAAEAAERAAPASPAAAAQAADAAIRTERTRVAAINEIGTRAALPATDVAAAITNGESVEDFRRRAFDALTSRQASAPTASVNASITRDETDTRRRAMSGALVARLARASGERNVQIPEMSRAYGEMGLAEMAAEVIGHRGHLRTPRQVVEVMERAFHSTSDFPGIFSDALNTRLLGRYQQAMPTYRLFCAPYVATDFRAINVVRAGDFPAPQRILETGEIPASTFGESKEQLTVHPYGVRIGISRQMIVNDNLGAIDQMLGSYSDVVLNWENGLAFEALVSNSYTGPTLLTDSTVMFHTSHGNETASGTAISIASVGAGRAKMMKQTGINGRKLNLQPVTILTGPDRLTEAEQLVATINPALIANAQTDWMKRLRPAGDANIENDHWYLFADPAVAPCFVYGTLQGFEGPRLSVNDPFTVQGIEVKLEHDFGVAGIDYRGATHNEGAPPA